MFQGDLLDCHGIILLYNRFSSMPAATSETCNNGRVRGYSLPINDSEPCYTSQLHVMVSPDMIGKRITCAYDSGVTLTEVGNYSIEQCHTTTVTTIATFTGKLEFMWENYINFI